MPVSSKLPPLPRLPKGFVRWGKPRRGPIKSRPIEMGTYHVWTYNGPGSWETPRPLMGDSDNIYAIAYRK